MAAECCEQRSSVQDAAAASLQVDESQLTAQPENEFVCRDSLR
jgi:hypothetical protein